MNQTRPTLPTAVVQLLEKSPLRLVEAQAALSSGRLCLGQVCALLGLTYDEWTDAGELLADGGVRAFICWRTNQKDEPATPEAGVLARAPDA